MRKKKKKNRRGNGNSPDGSNGNGVIAVNGTEYISGGCPVCHTGLLVPTRSESRVMGEQVYRCMICARRLDKYNVVLY